MRCARTREAKGPVASKQIEVMREGDLLVAKDGDVEEVVEQQEGADKGTKDGDDDNGEDGQFCEGREM